MKSSPAPQQSLAVALLQGSVLSIDDMVWCETVRDHKLRIEHSEHGHPLTDDELRYIKLTRRCPDCKTTVLQQQSCSGMSEDTHCPKCGSSFNVSLLPLQDARNLSSSYIRSYRY